MGGVLSSVLYGNTFRCASGENLVCLTRYLVFVRYLGCRACLRGRKAWRYDVGTETSSILVQLSSRNISPRRALCFFQNNSIGELGMVADAAPCKQKILDLGARNSNFFNYDSPVRPHGLLIPSSFSNFSFLSWSCLCLLVCLFVCRSSRCIPGSHLRLFFLHDRILRVSRHGQPNRIHKCERRVAIVNVAHTRTRKKRPALLIVLRASSS